MRCARVTNKIMQHLIKNDYESEVGSGKDATSNYLMYLTHILILSLIAPLGIFSLKINIEISL